MSPDSCRMDMYTTYGVKNLSDIEKCIFWAWEVPLEEKDSNPDILLEVAKMIICRVY